MYDQHEKFNTFLDVSRHTVELATEDPAARNLTDRDMQNLAFTAGLRVVGGANWWDAIREVYNNI